MDKFNEACMERYENCPRIEVIQKLIKDIEDNPEKNKTSMILGYEYIGDEGVKYLAESPCAETLVWLDLSWNHLGPKGAKFLANSPYLKNLDVLILSFNKIGDEGVNELARSPYLKNLTVLGLMWNGISETKALSETLLGNFKNTKIYV